MSATMFSQTSRYYGIETATVTTADGRIISYVRRRFVPDLSTLPAIAEYVVSAGDRLDNVTAAQLGDPEQFWRVCDANGAIVPDELTGVPGRRLRITMPQGTK